MPVRTEAAYEEFFKGQTLDWVYDEFIADKLVTSQILLLLHKQPLPTGKIAEALNLSPSDVSRHMNNGSRHGWVRYHADSQCYALS